MHSFCTIIFFCQILGFFAESLTKRGRSQHFDLISLGENERLQLTSQKNSQLNDAIFIIQYGLRRMKGLCYNIWVLPFVKFQNHLFGFPFTRNRYAYNVFKILLKVKLRVGDIRNVYDLDTAYPIQRQIDKVVFVLLGYTE